MSIFKKYHENQNGNVGMMFAIIAVPILIAVGAAIDYARLESASTKIQSAVDAAALSGALAYLGEGQEGMQKNALKIIETNQYLASDLKVLQTKVEKTQQDTVVVRTSGSLKPKFVQIFGHPKLDFEVVSEAALGSLNGLEIAIAFDVTNSMAFDNRWDTAMTAVGGTLNEMKDFTGRDDFQVSLVPFSDKVNIGNKNSGWLNQSPQNDWDECVQPREYAELNFQWAVDDKSPLTHRFEPSISNEKGSWGGTLGCPNLAITGPTNNVNEIIQATGNMTSGGTGRFDIGLAWAWRLLSPNWRGEWGVSDYPANEQEDREKKIIFVTDGSSEAGAHGFSKESDWGFNQGSVIMFEHVVELCRKIKAQDIEIYFLNLEGNPHAVDYFKQCASSPSHYYQVSEASDIAAAFKGVLTDIKSDLRLIR